MNIRNISKAECLGCAACSSICPTNAIAMQEDEEGFLYPLLNESACINCEKCYKTCPVNNNLRGNNDNVYYAGIHNNKHIWAASTSGGAFSGICEIYGDENTYIFGAVFDAKTKRIEHRVVKGVSNASAFYGSKYVQSRIDNVYVELKNLLQKGESVVFSGTPCQVSALLSYLKNSNRENLLTISLVCNGVGSPGVFSDYLNAIEKKHGSRVIDYRFRDKIIKNGVHQLYRTTTKFENGTASSSNDDVYNNCYVQKIVCRKSCFHCRYNIKTIESDITIGDFKKQYLVIDKAPYDRNGSIIVSHTAKGNSICCQLERVMTMYNIDESAFEYPSHGSYNEAIRNKFYSEYQKKDTPVTDLLNKYSSNKSVIHIIWGSIPDKARGKIKKLMRIDR